MNTQSGKPVNDKTGNFAKKQSGKAWKKVLNRDFKRGFKKDSGKENFTLYSKWRKVSGTTVSR